MKLLFAKAARQELEEAAGYVAEHNPRAARNLEERVLATAQRLTVFPHLGRPLDDTGRRRFEIGGTPYRLIYAVRRDAVVILRIWHGARRWPPVS